MNHGLAAFSESNTIPVRRPYPAFVRPEEVEGTLLTLLATITDDGKDVGYPQVREWRGEDWFKDLVAACAKSWAHLGGIDLHRSAFHRPQAPNTSDGLPIYGRDQSVRWRFWPTAPLLRTDDPQDALPFCAVKDAQGKTPPSFRPRLLGFLGSAPNLFLDPKRAEAAADAAIAALDLDPAKPRSGEFPDWLAEAWRGQSPNMGAAGFFEVDIQMRAEFGGHGKLLVTPPRLPRQARGRHLQPAEGVRFRNRRPWPALQCRRYGTRPKRDHRRHLLTVRLARRGCPVSTGLLIDKNANMG